MAGGDRIAQYVLSLGGDDADLRAVFAGLKSTVRSQVAELESITGKIDLFSQIGDNIPKIKAALDRATDAAAGFGSEIEKIKAAGGKVGDDLQKSFDASLKSARDATAELKKQTTQYDVLGSALTRVGVNTKNLAAEQQRYAVSLAEATAAAKLQEAQQGLGLITTKSIQSAIAKLNADYQTLASSGKLSQTELAAAASLLQTRTDALRATVNATGETFKGGVTEAKAFFTGIQASALATVAAVAGVASAVNSAITAAKEYNRGVAEVGTVSNLTKQQLDGLGTGARELARTIGFDLNAGLKALYEIIRSGVPPENALEVLKISAEAAKAGLTDVGTATKAANLLISAFGVPVKDLGGAFDVLVRSAQDGGATLGEFATSAGPLLNVARAAGVSLGDLSATLTVMVNAGVDAGTAMSDLSKIIVKLGDPTVIGKLQELGIQSGGLVETLVAIKSKSNEGLNALLDLGVGSTKSAAGVAALSNNIGALTTEQTKNAASAGAMADANEKLKGTSVEASDKLSAAWHETNLTWGESFGAGTKLTGLLTDLLNRNTDLTRGIAEANKEGRTFDAFLLSISGGLLGTKDAAVQAAPALEAVGTGAKKAASDLIDSSAKIETTRASLSKFIETLVADIQALQAASAQDVANVKTRADEEIAALDRSLAATQATATATIKIRTEAAQQQLAILESTEQKTTAALEKAVAARIALLTNEGKTAAQIETDIAKLKLGTIDAQLKGYQALYKDLEAAARDNVGKINALESTRVDFNRGIEEQIRGIRLAGLSDIDQYAARLKHIDETIALGREVAATQGIEASKKYFDAAIAEANQLGTVVSVSGATIISQGQAQETKIGLLKKIQGEFNQALTDAGKAAKDGADATTQQMERVALKIVELETKMDIVRERIERAMVAKVELDAASVARVKGELDDLTAKRTVLIQTAIDAGAGLQSIQGGNGPTGFRRGGYVDHPVVQAFAKGGGVWKVPGSGTGDTVPAYLRAGSFVMSKPSVDLYGAGMTSLLRGYAGGGAVQSGFFGDLGSGTTRDAGTISPPTLPTDHRKLVELAMQYVTDVVRAARQDDGYYWGETIVDLQRLVRGYERRPTDQGLENVIMWARGIGLNLGISRGVQIGFDIDGRRWHDEGPALDGGHPGLAGLGRMWSFYARGGDVVPAMLTPGEWVVSPERTRELGSGLLNLVNRRGVTPAQLARAMLPAPPQPRYLSGGGPVPGAIIPERGTATGAAAGGRPLVGELHLHGAPADFYSRENLRRFMLPALNDIIRASK